MKRKAQTEIVIIIILVAMVGLAGYLVYQMVLVQNDETAQLNEAQRSVKQSADTFITQEFLSVLKEFYSTGGISYEEIDNPSKSSYRGDYALFSGQKVVYWQKCDSFNQLYGNDMKAKMEAQLNKTINEKLDYLKTTFSKDVEFLEGVKSLSINIFDDKVELVLDMPTTVEGQTFSSYKIPVSTELGKITKFSKAFAEENANKRYFEQFVYDSMRISF